MENAAESYDSVPYPGFAYKQTHPDRLATIAALFGMSPAPPAACRVLEVGCGDGGNLIPMAFALPGSQFTGVDAAARAIERGQSIAAALGLGNVALPRLDLRGIPGDFGRFDYIIAHGLYSWVAPEVRESLMALIRSSLAPNGVAYVSYNTYPGGHVRKMLREMMLFHAPAADAEERMEQARAFLHLLADSQPQSDAWGSFIRSQAEEMLGRPAEILFHDELSEVFAPVYFHDFAEDAARHGLQYLGEAKFSAMQAGSLPQAAQEALERIPDVVLREQHLDLLKCRKFRQTLLCCKEVALERPVKAERVTKMHIASFAEEASAEEDGVVAEFRSPQGWSLKTSHPLVKAALRELSAVWPTALAFSDLLERTGSNDARTLADVILHAYGLDVVELYTDPARLAARAGARPAASPVARLQAQEGPVVTTPRHTRVEIQGAIERRLVTLLDGTRDRAALLGELAEFTRALPEQERREITPDNLERTLAALVRLGLLLA